MGTINEYKMRAICDVVRYYAETTGQDCSDFIESLRLVTMGQIDIAQYSQWLVQECFKVLTKRGITVADIMSQRTMLQSITDTNRKIPIVRENVNGWYIEGNAYIKKVMGTKWQNAKIWCATAGLGDVLSDATDCTSIYLSAMDLDTIKSKDKYNGAECFELDFLTMGTAFTEKLPESLRNALLCNDEIVIMLQLPDRVVKAGANDIGREMVLNGYSLCAFDVSMQFIYRLLLLKKQYNLTNLIICLYSSNVMFNCRAMQSLYSEFLCNFEYKAGMCFTLNGNTPIDDIHSIYFTVWKSYDVALPFEPTVAINIDMKERENGIVKTSGVITKHNAVPVALLEEWVKPKKEVISSFKEMPMFSTYNEARTTMKVPEDTMGCFVSKYNDTEGVNRCRVYSGAAQGGISIVPENFERVVAAFAVRRLVDLDVQNSAVTSHFMAPDVSKSGYKEWVMRCIPLFLFDTENYACSCRNFECANKMYNISNSFYPISSEYVPCAVEDKVLLQDVSLNGPTNAFILEIIKEAKHYFDAVTFEFYNFCITAIRDTYDSNIREIAGYPNWTNAWDASLTQIRLTNNNLLWDKTKADKYAYLLSKYKKSIEYGVYSFGFKADFENIKTDLEDLVWQ